MNIENYGGDTGSKIPFYFRTSAGGHLAALASHSKKSAYEKLNFKIPLKGADFFNDSGRIRPVLVLMSEKMPPDGKEEFMHSQL